MLQCDNSYNKDDVVVVVDSESNSSCVRPTSQARSEKCRSTAVRSSTSVKVAVTGSLSMESILMDFVVAGKSIHWKHIFCFHISNSFRLGD